MQVEWYGQSAFRLAADGTTVAIDPFGDMAALGSSHGMQWEYPAIAGLEASLLLVTHEHRDHNAAEVVGGEPEVLRSTAGTPRVRPRRGRGDRLRARRAGRHPARAQHDLRLRAGTACVSRTWATSVRASCGTSRPPLLGGLDLLILPVGDGPTIGAPGARAIVERLAPRWVVPMHYRTPRIGFLETAEEFLAGSEHVHRLDGPSFETGRLPAAEGPLVVVPAAP